MGLVCPVLVAAWYQTKVAKQTGVLKTPRARIGKADYL
jgi:hypothetical protein